MRPEIDFSQFDVSREEFNPLTDPGRADTVRRQSPLDHMVCWDVLGIPESRVNQFAEIDDAVWVASGGDIDRTDPIEFRGGTFSLRGLAASVLGLIGLKPTPEFLALVHVYVTDLLDQEATNGVGDQTRPLAPYRRLVESSEKNPEVYNNFRAAMEKIGIQLPMTPRKSGGNSIRSGSGGKTTLWIHIPARHASKHASR